jgi:hypothetical protein
MNTTGDRWNGDSDAGAGNTRDKVINPGENASGNKPKKVIGRQVGNTLKEISIFPVNKEVDPFKPGGRQARSSIGKEKRGQESEMQVDSQAELTE